MGAVSTGAGPAELGRFNRTECVYPAGPPNEGYSSQGKILRHRNLGYVGILTDNDQPIGTNRGVVDIDLNQDTGVGTIRGTLEIRDEAMGDFDGRFGGEYERGSWHGRGWATGVGDHTGKLLKMDIEGFDPSTCHEHPDLGTAIDGAFWDVVIVDSNP